MAGTSGKSNAENTELKPLKLESGDIWDVAKSLATQMLEAADKSVGLREKDLKDFKKKLKSLQKLVESEAGNKTARNSLERLSSRRDEQVADLEALHSHQSDVVSLRDAIFALREQTTLRDELYEKAMSEIEALNARVEALDAEGQATASERDGFATDIAKLTGETEKLKAANSALKQLIDKQAVDLTDYKSETDAATDAQAEAEAKLEALRVECDEQATRADDLEAEAAQARLQCEEAVAALATLQSESDAAYKTLEQDSAATLKETKDNAATKLKDAKESAAADLKSTKEAASAELKNFKKESAEKLKAAKDDASAKFKAAKEAAAAELKTTKETAAEKLKALKEHAAAEYNALEEASNKEMSELERTRDEAFAHALELQKVVDVLSDHAIEDSIPMRAAPGPVPDDDEDDEVDDIDVDIDADDDVMDEPVSTQVLDSAVLDAKVEESRADEADAFEEESDRADAAAPENKDPFTDAFATLGDDPEEADPDDEASPTRRGSDAMEIVGMDFPGAGSAVDADSLDAFLGDGDPPAPPALDDDAPDATTEDEAPNTDFESVLFSLEPDESSDREKTQDSAPMPVPLPGGEQANLDPPIAGNPMIRARPRLSRHKYQTREAVRIAGILDHNAYQVDELIRLSGLKEDVVRTTLGVFLSLELIEIEDEG